MLLAVRLSKFPIFDTGSLLSGFHEDMIKEANDGWPANDVASEPYVQLDRDCCQEAPSDRVDMWVSVSSGDN